MSTISIAAKDTRLDEHPWGFCDAGARIRRWSTLGPYRSLHLNKD